MDHTECEKLLNEYQALRRRLDEPDQADTDHADAPEKTKQEDRARLQEIREIIDQNCEADLPDKPDGDLDIPKFTQKSPSEPMDAGDDPEK